MTTQPEAPDELDQIFYQALRGKTLTPEQAYILEWAEARLKPALLAREERLVREAQNEVLEWLENDLKRLDSRNWTSETMALDYIVGSGKADEHQIAKRNDIVTDRRAAHALYAILSNYRKQLTNPIEKEKKT